MKNVMTKDENLEVEKLYETIKLDNAIEESKLLTRWLEELKSYRETNLTPKQLSTIKNIDWDNVRDCAAELIKYTEIGYTPEQISELCDNRGWIPCSEKVPERGVGVRVYAKRGDVGYQFDAFVAFRELKWFTYDSTKIGSLKSNKVDSSYEITHWMPHPEPPEKIHRKEDGRRG